MLLRLVISIIFIISINSSVYSQAQVGTTGTQFLNLSQAVKSNGMGSTGAALVTNESMFFNPGTMGLYLLENKISLSTSRSDMPADIKLYNSNISLPLRFDNFDYKTAYGFSYYLSRLNSGEMIVRDYNNGTFEGTGRTFSWTNIAHNLVFAYGYSSVIDFGIGFTAKFINESPLDDYSASGWGIDLGMIIGKEINLNRYSSSEYIITLKPLFGLSMRNLGPDMTMINNSYSLPRNFIGGMSSEFSISKMNDNGSLKKIFSIIPAVEFQENSNDVNTLYRGGIEISLMEVISIRRGWKENDNNASTYGFSLRSKGIINLLSNSESTSLLKNKLDIEYSYAIDKIDIKYNYANDNQSHLPDISYHSISLSYYLDR